MKLARTVLSGGQARRPYSCLGIPLAQGIQVRAIAGHGHGVSRCKVFSFARSNFGILTPLNGHKSQLWKTSVDFANGMPGKGRLIGNGQFVFLPGVQADRGRPTLLY